MILLCLLATMVMACDTEEECTAPDMTDLPEEAELFFGTWEFRYALLTCARETDLQPTFVDTVFPGELVDWLPSVTGSGTASGYYPHCTVVLGEDLRIIRNGVCTLHCIDLMQYQRYDHVNPQRSFNGLQLDFDDLSVFLMIQYFHLGEDTVWIFPPYATHNRCGFDAPVTYQTMEYFVRTK